MRLGPFLFISHMVLFFEYFLLFKFMRGKLRLEKGFFVFCLFVCQFRDIVKYKSEILLDFKLEM